MRSFAPTPVHIATPPVVWPAAPNPAELYRRREEGRREDSVQDGNRPEIDSELLFAAPVPTLADFSKEAHMMVVGCRGQNALQRSPRLGQYRTGPSCPLPGPGDPRRAPILLPPSQLPVLVGIDGSPASELATAIAFDEDSFRGVELVALHACSDADMTTAPSTDSSGLRCAAEKTLAEGLAGFSGTLPRRHRLP
jgi:nucleotide-binding universal stress UspA family protein